MRQPFLHSFQFVQETPETQCLIITQKWRENSKSFFFGLSNAEYF